MANEKKISRKQKWIIGISLAVVVAVGAGFGVHHLQVKADEKEKQEKLASVDHKVKTYSKESLSWYTSAKKEDLKKKVTKADVKKLQKKLDTLVGANMSIETAEKLNTVVTDTGNAHTMVTLRDMVHQLLDDKGILVEKADVQSVKEQVDDFQKTKPVFVKKLQKKLAEAEKQDQVNQKAKKKVMALFTDKEAQTVKADVTQAQYDDAKKAVEQVKQPQLKEKWQGLLKKVKETLDKKSETTQKENNTTNDNNGTQSQATTPSAGNNDQASSSRSGSSHSQANGSSQNGQSSRQSVGSSRSQQSASSSGRSSGGRSSNSSSGHTQSATGSGSSHHSNPNQSRPTKPSKPSGNSGSSSNSGGMKPGDSWNGNKTEQGYIDGEDGNTWGTIEW